MKKIISLLLVILMTGVLLISVTGCNSSSKVIGIWKDATSSEDKYRYFYSDGTGDIYMKWWGETDHFNSYTWEISGDMVSCIYDTSVVKYTIKDDCLYDKQGKLAYEKVQDDTSVDLVIY